MTTATANKTGDVRSVSWSDVPPQEGYTGDDLINAYLKGCDEGLERQRKILLKVLEDNLSDAKVIVEKFYAQLNKNFTCSYLKLRVKELTEFDVLFVVDKADFISDEFMRAYKEARKIKKKVNQSPFELSFSFMPISERIDEKKLLIDGYCFTYGN
jgi:hypothetical protein